MTTAQDVRTMIVFNAETVAASGNSSSAAINLNDFKPNGYFSLQITLTGSGTGKFEYELSNDGVNYLTPSSAADIITAHDVTTGPASDGKDLYSFSPELAKYMKIKVTETSTTDAIVVTAILALQ